MTCRYDGSEPLDVLYTSVRNTPGGVADAAAFLTNRRGKSIHTESLRLRLRNEGENRLSFEMFELLIEWMEEKRQDHAHDALIALNERFGYRAISMNDESDSASVDGIALSTLEIASQTGAVAREVIESLDDGRIDDREVERISTEVRKSHRLLDKLVRNVLRLNKANRR